MNPSAKNPAKAAPKLPYKPRIKRDERRALIEQAASRLFAERGYDGASLEEIAAAAGISKAVLYDHFPSKAELHVSLISASSEQLMTAAAEAAVSAEGPLESFRAGAEAFFEFVETHEFAWRMIFRDAPSDPDVAAACRGISDGVTLGIAAMLRTESEATAVVEADDPERTEMFAVQIKNAMAGLASWWYEHRDRPRADIVAALMDLTWVGIERVASGERWQPPD